MTQLESARQGIVTPEMRRIAAREAVGVDLIRDEVARGRLVIPANVRHLAGSGGAAPATPPTAGTGNGDVANAGGPGNTGNAQGAFGSPDAIGHPGARPGARLWVNQTVAQRQAEIADERRLSGERAPKRLDP